MPRKMARAPTHSETWPAWTQDPQDPVSRLSPSARVHIISMSHSFTSGSQLVLSWLHFSKWDNLSGGRVPFQLLRTCAASSATLPELASPNPSVKRITGPDSDAISTCSSYSPSPSSSGNSISPQTLPVPLAFQPTDAQIHEALSKLELNQSWAWLEIYSRLHGNHDHGDAKYVARHHNRKTSILSFRAAIKESFKACEKEMRAVGLEAACLSVARNVRALDNFEQMFPDLPVKQLSSPSPSSTNLPDSSTQFLSSTPGESAALTALIILSTIISLFPTILAFRASSEGPGSPSDADFYLLAQSSVTQFCGIIVATVPLLRDRGSVVAKWAVGFAVAGLVCTVGCVPMYLLVPKRWSAFVALLGSVAQMAMILELGLLARLPGKVKAD